MSSVKLTIDAFGETLVDVIDGQGTSCELATKNISDALSSVFSKVDTDYKEEYYSGDKEVEAHVVQN